METERELLESIYARLVSTDRTLAQVSADLRVAERIKVFTQLGKARWRGSGDNAANDWVPFGQSKFLDAASARTFSFPGMCPAVKMMLYRTWRKDDICRRKRMSG